MSVLVVAAFAAAVAAASPGYSTPGAICEANEAGPALRVTVTGLKDRRGVLRLELYPDNDADFLADDVALLAAGKPFRRTETPTPPAGDEVVLCVRAAAPGRYAAALLHSRSGAHKFSLFTDGIGLANNPKFAFAKPHAAQAAVDVGPGVTDISVVLNYWNGLGFGPTKSK